jgi:hypothetical protein
LQNKIDDGELEAILSCIPEDYDENKSQFINPTRQINKK